VLRLPAPSPPPLLLLLPPPDTLYMRSPASTAARASVWHALAASPAELRLQSTLENGQCFGWHKQPGEDPVWVGVLGRRLLMLRETATDTEYRCLTSSGGGHDDTDAIGHELRDYFQLSTPLVPLYEEWSAADTRMKTVASCLPGMRVLRQEPIECLFSFICSSNNNIGRIGGMLQAIRRAYGSKLPPVEPAGAGCGGVDGEDGEDGEGGEGGEGGASGDAEQGAAVAIGHGGATDFYTFPTADVLASADEAELRALGLGYRAAYVRKTAALLCEKGDGWLRSMRDVDDPDAVRTMLMECPGVGPKVADCVALFSLDQSGAIPVDTHVWDIACRDLDRSLSSVGSLTPKVYTRVGCVSAR
jgi:N-glycosylase/DNA lyase